MSASESDEVITDLFGNEGLLARTNSENISAWDKSVEVEENLYYWKEDPIFHSSSRFLDVNGPLVVELFSGCGGTSLGFEMAGYSIGLGMDIHGPSVSTFQYNHPHAATVLGDIKRVKPQQLADLLSGHEIDVLIGGVPCQGFSLNNRKRHIDDKRNLLYKEFIRFAKALKPKAIVLENVSGMRSSGDFVARIEEDLGKAAGMRVHSAMLNAHEYGVPQRRQRLIFVGVRGKDFDFRSIKKTHGPGTSSTFNTVRDAIGDLPSLASGEEKTAYATKPNSIYQKLMRAGLKLNQLTNHRAPNHPAETIRRIAETEPGFPMYPAFRQRIRLAWDAMSPTQVSGGIRPQFQFGHPEDARGLTIRERCRIQSFPDSFFVSGGIVQGRVQTGNAVPPLLAKAVGLALKDFL